MVCARESPLQVALLSIHRVHQPAGTTGIHTPDTVKCGAVESAQYARQCCGVQANPSRWHVRHAVRVPTLIASCAVRSLSATPLLVPSETRVPDEPHLQNVDWNNVRRREVPPTLFANADQRELHLSIRDAARCSNLHPLHPRVAAQVA